MLALSWAVMAALLTFGAYASQREQLLERSKVLIFFYYLVSLILMLCILLSIVADGFLQRGDTTIFFGILDLIILVLTAVAMSSSPVLSWITYRRLQEPSLPGSNGG